jgi:hypothetical protein
VLDLFFSDRFVIPSASTEYAACLKRVPLVFVGSTELLVATRVALAHNIKQKYKARVSCE